MTHTEHYELSQWQKSDRLMMSDFNADNQKLDAALTSLSFVTGQYTGENHSSTTTEQTITLGFRPRVVLVFPAGESFSAGNWHMALALDGLPCNGITITDTGFTAAGQMNLMYRNEINNAYCNPYRYIAWH